MLLKIPLFAMGRGDPAIDNNVIIDAMGALIVLIMLFAGRTSARDAAPQTRMIRRLMVYCALVFLLDIPGLLLDGRCFPGARGWIWLFDTAYWLAHIGYFWLWLTFADLWVLKTPEAVLKRRARLYALPMLAETAIVLSNPWTGWLFTLNECNRYAPGAAYQLCLTPHYVYLAASLAIAFFGYRSTRDVDRRRRCLHLTAYMFLPTCGAAMELLAYGISWVWSMIALSLLMVQLNEQQRILADEQLSVARAAEKAARMDAEMADSRMAIMLSQIQPHFLYNSLCVIQDLCHGNAPKAEEATLAFSRFLRGNLDSLKASRPISFEQELNHTKYYLALEQMRFGDRLKVEYDLRADNFRLPALTLQPIVENAVRYGVMKKETGGTVRISSAQTHDAFSVTVEDDGVGFDPYQKHEDGRTHIGIDNVGQRLRAMCGGDLNISSRPGEGTVATITLPKGANGHENFCA